MFAPPPAKLTAQTSKDTNLAAADQILASYEGQTVTAVDLAGRPELQISQFSPLLEQRAGQPFDKQKVDSTAASIKTTGKFQSVRVQVQPEANGLRVLFVIEPAIYYGIFEFPGAERFNYARLVQVANYEVQSPYSATEIERDRKLLATFFQQSGYFQAQVSSALQIDQQHGIVNILFHSDLGRKAKFGEIDIAGLPLSESTDLQHRLTTLFARIRGAAVRDGKSFNRSTLNKATNYIQSRLQKEGFLGAQVKLDGAEYHADSNRADIRFSVKAGAKTQVQIAGAHLWPWAKRNLLPEYQGVGVNEETVQEGQRALISYYQAKGFFDVKVTSNMSGDDRLRTVIYHVTKEKKHKLTDVRLTGESQLKAADLEPHITVHKHFFSHGQFSDQLVRSSVKNLTAVYKSQGFSSVQVTSSVVNRGGDIQVEFRITEGPRDMVNALTIEGANTFPESQFAPTGLKVAAGQPYSQANVEADRASIVANYLKAGYLTSSFRETASEVSKKDLHHINVVYHIYEGPRVFTGEILTLGRLHTQQRLINNDITTIKPDEPLTETDLLTADSNLYNHTGVFDWSQVDPKSQINTQTSESVLVKVHEAKRNEFTYSFGVEVINRGGSVPSGTVALPGLPPVGLPSNFKTSQVTFYGPRGSAQYTRNNLRGKGESLSLTAFAGRLDQRAAVYYIAPNFLWSSWKSTVSTSFERDEENPIFSSQQELGSYQVQRYIDRAKNDLFFVKYSYGKTDLTRIEIPELVPTADQHVRLSGFGANLTRDTRDNVIDEHRGMLGSLEVDINSSRLGASVDFAKLTSQAAVYKEKFHHIVWAGSIRIGLAQPFPNGRVPLSEAFFTGGGDSLRGFPLYGAGPQRNIYVCSTGQTSPNCPQINVPSGGNELMVINAESRIPLPMKKGLSIVPFYDGGNVFPRIGFHDFTSLYSNNVGLGLRYSTPVGPIRIDVGHNLNPVPGVSSTQYFISIGQAF
jgi:outer membrane protein assembly factor BamA